MIGFLHPWILVGLVAAAIPILLHLLARREPPTVVFPAVRYLVTTTREHQRRLKLQNWLLLLLRTLLIATLVLAAAGPTVPLSGVPGHAPSALVLIVDNSPSSGAMAGGSPQLAQLVTAGRRVMARATPEDAVWLITADGIPRRGNRTTLGELLDSLTVSPRRMDLGASIALAGEVLETELRPGEIVLLTDLQASALSPAAPTVPLLVGRPGTPPPANTGIGQIETGTQPWSSDGGRISVVLVGDSGAAVPVSARLGDRPGRQALGRVGGTVALTLPGAPAGWWTLTTALDPDEFRLDDTRVVVVRVAPVARVKWDSTSRFVAAASEVLASNGRIRPGQEVTLGRLARGASVVQPPEDAAELGALNRALAARGVGWSFGNLFTTMAFSDSGPVVPRQRVTRRYALQSSGSGRTGILATVNGAPWIVRDGNVILLGSRLDPGWTDLPVSAGFMPFMDVLLNRLARGEAALGQGAPGDPVPLPDLVTGVRRDEHDWRVEGGGLFQPPDPGVYYLLAGRDTVGAISVNPDPRESRLTRASDAQVRRLWKGARLVQLEDAADIAFSSASRGDLRGPLLWFALLAGMAEVGLASAWRRRA
ncbi:MAG TPA: BatA and WFA domain-containing protein [Gemmatimonadales bacterium]|nr:BatA and WFA domain-containing protein [Gemmatimonadales bacterium]